MNLPYLPENREILYIDENNKYMQEAKKQSLLSGCAKQKVGCVIVVDEKVVAHGANGDNGKHGIPTKCQREVLGCKTGEGYENCTQCQESGHAEAVAIREKKSDIFGGDLYLFGHWWVCKPCWDRIIQSEIKNVYLCQKKYLFFLTKLVLCCNIFTSPSFPLIA